MKPRKKPRAERSSRDELLRTIPSWDDVRFFLAIHRAGSLSAAAGPLAVTQPTCGRRLAALEASLGLRLFDRTPEGLRLTAEGATLLDAATTMEQSAHDLALRATVSDRELEGVVRIATNEFFACSFLVGALPQVRDKYPGVRVELVLSNTETDLLRREADIAIRFRPEGYRPTPELLVAQKLGDEPFCLYGADPYLRRRGTPSDSGRPRRPRRRGLRRPPSCFRVVRERISRRHRGARGSEHAGELRRHRRRSGAGCPPAPCGAALPAPPSALVRRRSRNGMDGRPSGFAEGPALSRRHRHGRGDLPSRLRSGLNHPTKVP